MRCTVFDRSCNTATKTSLFFLHSPYFFRDVILFLHRILQNSAIVLTLMSVVITLARGKWAERKTLALWPMRQIIFRGRGTGGSFFSLSILIFLLFVVSSICLAIVSDLGIFYMREIFRVMYHTWYFKRLDEIAHSQDTERYFCLELMLCLYTECASGEFTSVDWVRNISVAVSSVFSGQQYEHWW